MRAKVEYLSNKASVEEIDEHLRKCDADFVPLLSSRVEISDYAQKIASKAMRFEAWSKGVLIGLVAAYCNDREKSIAFITSVSLMKEWMGKGIATHLMHQCIKHMHVQGIRQICLEVASDNMSAIRLYEKCGFITGNANAPFVTMNLYLKSGEEYEQQA
jgi:ribosomal protein S18 acetylase RimI-like enzyme